MSKIFFFTGKTVRLAKNAVGGRGEVAAPEGGDDFTDYAVVSLHCLRVYMDKSYRDSLDLLSEMPQILAKIGLDEADLTYHSTLYKRLTDSKQHSGERCCTCRRSQERCFLCAHKIGKQFWDAAVRPQRSRRH